MYKVDLNNWKRRDQFKLFSNYSNPYYVIGFNLDVTKVKEFAKNNGVSFYKTMIYCVSEAINKTEEFLYIYKDNEVYKIDKRYPSYTLFNEKDESFRFLYADTSNGFKRFIEDCKAQEENKDTFIDNDKEGEELIYITSLPWLDMTSFTNAINLNNEMDSIPRFAWGKYKNEGDRLILNMSLEVNHAFIDGFHIEKLIKNFVEVANKLGEKYYG